ncbi:MAG: family transcriptional regulator, cyclic receptor protein [Frankiaceae bacterium]|nr:family transcriptional regulator, cyclic receptor protein [Frankiaceae bacterium]
MEDAARLLRETALFSGIDQRTAEEVARRMVRRTLRRGQPLFHQGDRGDALYVVVDGSVAVVVSSENGDRMVLTTLHPPDSLGEIALLDGGNRSASAEAVEETTTLVLSRAAFLELLRDHPPLAEQLLRSLGALVRRLSEQASDFVFLDLPGRVAKVLVRLAEDSGPEVAGVPVEVAVTQGRLAEMAGGSRQSVNQILQSFQQRGLIEVQGRRVLICRPEQLRRRGGLSV